MMEANIGLKVFLTGLSWIALYGATIWTMAWINQLVKFLGQMVNKEDCKVPPHYGLVAALSWVAFYAFRSILEIL